MSESSNASQPAPAPSTSPVKSMDEIMALSDRIAVIYEGRIMAILPRGQATPAELGLLMAGVQAGG